VITRERHPFEGRSLSVIHSIRRRGIRLVLVILPNGTRSLIPVAWTDWIPEQSPGAAKAIPHISNDLGRLDDLLRLRALIKAFLSRPSESAPHEGSSHAIPPCLSRADGSAAESDGTNKPSVVAANRRSCADGRTRAPRSAHRVHARRTRGGDAR